MAFPSFIPLNIPFPLNPSPSSSLLISPASSFPILQTRNHLRIKAYLSTRTLQPSDDEEYPEAEPPLNTVEIKKKKKKRKLRPSFYDQTLERWSLKISSRRSKFPWQEQTTEKKKDDCLITGIPSDNTLGIRVGEKPRNAHLDSEPIFRNPVRDLEFNEEGVKSRLGLIIEKLDSSLDHSSSNLNVGFSSTSSYEEERLGSEGTSSIAKPVGIPLGILGRSAPWVHGAKPRETHSDFIAKTQTSQENFKFDVEDEQGGAGLMDEKPNGSLDQNNENSYQNACLSNPNDEERPNFNKSAILASLHMDKSPAIAEKLGVPLRNGVTDNIKTHLDPHVTTETPLRNLEFSEDSGKSRVSLIVEQLKDSMDQNSPNLDVGISSDKFDDGRVSNSDHDIVNLVGSVSFPWERDNGGSDGERLHKRSNTELAEKVIPEPELRRLRNVALRMKERMKVGPAGITEAVVKSIHRKWKEDEVVKLRFEGPPALNMKRTHEMLERKTGGLVIWRSGSSVVLYRGMTYELPCVQSYSKLADTDSNDNNFPSSNHTNNDIVGNTTNGLVRVSERSDVSTTYVTNPSDGSTDGFDIESLLDQLGPRYKDWSGRNPLPVDADLLPGVVDGYKPPFRLLPYKTRSGLINKQMTSLRRLARTMSPHFALGRNRQHQGLASAMVKLWEKSAIAKIAIKRGVPNTCNERMAEEIKKLTGGILLCRNKDFIVFYRGNDYLTPSIREALVEKQKLATVQQDKEEVARLRASALIVSNAKTAKGPLVAGTLAETLEANTRWGNQPSSEDREKMKRDLALAKHVSLVRYLERKLAFARAKVRKAEKALAKVQEFLDPAQLPTDLETVTDEERFLFRKMGLKMRAFLLLGRRGVFDGTVENMHLNWKHRELVKIIVKGKSFAQVKHIAISLEAESGGVLISLDKTTKGYAIIIYRGKNYNRPQILRPKNLLTRRQALARSIELQRREALNHHISDLQERIEMLNSQLDKMEADKELGNEHLDLKVDDTFPSDDDVEDEGEEAYLNTYSSSNEDGDDDASVEEFEFLE